MIRRDMERDSKIYVAGHRGLVGSSVVRRLQAEGYNNVVMRSHKELDLMSQRGVKGFFQEERPEYVFLCAAKVGGIGANEAYPAEFIYNNIMIQSNVIHGAHLAGVKKLLFLGSSCIYPRDCLQPIKEEYLLTGKLEKTNEPYAVAKIAGIKMCQSYNRQYGTSFISVMPTNLYGPGDNFDLETSHVLSALIRKFHDAKIGQEKNRDTHVTVWGTGSPRREFLHVDDLADAGIFLMNHYAGSEIVNIGVGKDISVKELAFLMRDIVGFNGEVRFDPSRPDGTPRKLLDISRMKALGWQAKIPLREGIDRTYRWYAEKTA
jgi:GDP-L-fucose synthase